MSRREKHEVIKAVLEAVETPAKRSHIFFKANLGWRYGSDLLDSLVLKGFVEEASSRPLLYALTEDGRKWLELLRALDSFEKLPVEEMSL